MSARSRRPEPCSNEDCGSRRFHVGDDGFTYCDQGHQQSERGTVIAEDTGEGETFGKKTKRRDSETESVTSRASRATSFSGSQAVEHYLLCIQLVLRKQLRWLIDVQKLPEELEHLVRDLWAIRLQKLQHKVSYESETDTEAPSSQVFSSQSEGESTSASQSSRRSRKQDGKPKEGITGLLDTLTFCYIGTLLLRIPITIADIHKWTNAGNLLYYRAAREVPLDMRERLPARYQELLEPQDLLQPQTLHQSALEMLKVLSKDFGMAPPHLNEPLVLFRWTRELSLPLEVFAATQRLQRILKIDSAFVLIAKPGSIVVLRYPEAKLMALMVISVKLLFPFDSANKHAYHSTDLSTMCLDWDQWSKSFDESDNDKSISQLSFEQAFDFNESDCLEAGEDRLDAYLHWYEDNIATEELRTRGRGRDDADFRRALFSMFPTGPDSSSKRRQNDKPTEGRAEDRLRKVQAALTYKLSTDNAANAEDTRPPGSFYRRFRSPEELSGPAKLFFGKAAELAGLSLDAIVQAVFSLERKLQKHEEALRKGNERE